MTKGQQQVKDFMDAVEQFGPPKPEVLDEATSKLRAHLILEEAFETITKGLGLRIHISDGRAIEESVVDEENLKLLGLIEFTKLKETNLVELADGLADLAYVGEFGTAVAAGIDLEPIQDEVDRSNKTKFWTKEEIDNLSENVGTVSILGAGERPFIVKSKTGKVIKSPSYSPANISELIQKQINPAPQHKEDIYKSCVTCPNCEMNSFCVEIDYCNECGCGSTPK